MAGRKNLVIRENYTTCQNCEKKKKSKLTEKVIYLMIFTQ